MEKKIKAMFPVFDDASKFLGSLEVSYSGCEGPPTYVKASGLEFILCYIVLDTLYDEGRMLTHTTSHCYVRDDADPINYTKGVFKPVK